jgi:hypothetical protein
LKKRNHGTRNETTEIFHSTLLKLSYRGATYTLLNT